MTEFKQRLGLLDATSIVAGSMIGSGIFLVSSSMARDLGSSGWLMVAWLLSGAITLMAALSYGELAGMMPEAGGQYVYIRRAWGKIPAFLYGWTVFSVIQTGVIAAVATAFANYTSELFPALAAKHVIADFGWFNITRAHLVAVASIILLTWFNTRGVQGGAWIAKIFTSAKLLALFALIILGLYVGFSHDTLSLNFDSPWDASRTFEAESGWVSEPLAGMALIAALGFTMINSLFSSDAWNNVTFIAGEIREPHKNIPRSLILGTAIVTALYLLANIAYLALLPLKGSPEGVDVASRGIQFAEQSRIGSAAATVIFGNLASAMMAVLIMVSTFGCNNGIILAGGRLFYAMSKDGLFFPRAGKLNSSSVPSWALWAQAVWASVLCFSGKYGDLLSYATFASLIFYIVTISGIFKLRRTEPDAPRPYKALGYPWIPALYIIAAALICIDLLFMDARNSGLGLVLVALGFPLYFLVQRLNGSKQ